jgi:Kef-type K+ transport system membrane component KefB
METRQTPKTCHKLKDFQPLTSIGSGFFIPLFFIMSGVEFDLPALVTSPASLARLILFCAGFLFVRLFPVLLYKHVLPERDLLPLALFSATTLPLVVAVTYLGVRTGDMLPENASALVGAAVIAVAVFPILAILIRSKSGEVRPEGIVAIVAHRVAHLAAALFSWFNAFFLRKHRGRGERNS